MRKMDDEILDGSRIAMEPRPCGHADSLGNPRCARKGRYGLWENGILIRTRCRVHIQELREEEGK